MSKTINLKKGFDINLAGKAEKKLTSDIMPDSFAFKPTDFHGILRPKLLVNEGDTVKAGTPILFDKKKPDVQFCSAVSGEVAEVVRGEKRKILEVRILPDKTMEYESFKSYSVSELKSIDRAVLQEQMLKSGVWPNIIQRPFGVIANPLDSPKAIFISAFDTHPLAPDLDYVHKGEEKYFQAGIDVLKKFTSGTIHLNVSAEKEVSAVFSNIKDVQLNKFSGPHPVGNVGVQIHHLDPISKGDIAWTVNPAGVIQIGKLFLEGKYDASIVFAVAGGEVKKPQYYKSYRGACIKKFVDQNVKSENLRYVSGNVLTGTRIAPDGYLGFYDQLLSIIKEGNEYVPFGWILPTDRLSYHRAIGLFSFLNKKKEHVLDTNTRGEPRAFVQTGIFEQVTPMDIFPLYLLKAIMAGDFDDMEALGIYEVIEEDLALCEFVDVSKHNIQEMVRDGIELIQNS